jgi:tetratricopeptide (TPR) repeat protein
MKRLYLFLLAVTYCHTGFAQDNFNKGIFRDSIFNKYVRDGAYTCSIYSKAYGTYIDSALLYLPQEAYLWQQRSMPLFKQMKYEAGMRYIDSSVKYDPVRWMPYRAFIKCIFQKNYTDALADFQKATALNGASGIMDHAYDFYIGLCYLQLNNYDAALTKLDKCINDREKKGNTGHYVHYFYKGIVLYEMGDYKGAITHFDKALVQYPTFSDAAFYKALCLANNGQISEAHQLMLKAQQDFNTGYTINEDNAIYERYPYQLTKNLLKSGIARFNSQSPD